MVGARQPQRRIALHPAPADQRVLQGLVHRVAEVQLPRDVRGRNDNRIRFLFRVDFGVEILSLHPEVIDAVFDLFRLVRLCKLFGHRLNPSVISIK